ncbi:MAG TPA: hydroxyacylglutathione hydrolase, partial [Hyphomonadaceae bacterium]|nr:hydroxyacylglutathione hydrolase [Hyphomonadaceae bacterium]
ALQIKQFACLADNYGFLIRDPVSGETAAIDTPCVETILGALDGAGWKLTQIWNTHWHPDHTGGNLALKEATGARVIGPKGEAGRIPGLDQAVGQGDQVRLGEKIADVLDTPGHTLGHIAFYFA